jgi:hypothetical protein
VFLLAFVIYSSSLFPPYLFPSTLDVSCCVALSGAAIVLVATRSCIMVAFAWSFVIFRHSVAHSLACLRFIVTPYCCFSLSLSLSLDFPASG